MSQLLELLALKEGFYKSDVLFDYLKSKAWEESTPISGLFELTPRCTLDCVMCYVHLSNTQMRKPELTTEQWISLIDQACDAGMLFATLTGGECLLYPDFRKLYEHLQSRGVLVTILTNGTLLNEEMVAWLSDRTPERVQISIYGSSPEGYEKVTGDRNAFYKVDKAIDLLTLAKIPFNLATAVSKQMMPDFEGILRYCESKNAGACRVNSFPFESREETQRQFEDYTPSLDDQVEIFKIQKRLFYEKIYRDSCGESICVSEVNTREHDSLPEKGITCSAGRNSFSINWEGKMIPCNIFDYAGSFPLEEGFQTSWQKLNEKCREYRNPVECIDCNYYKVCRFCPGGHYLKAGEGHANTNVCAEGKRMVSEKLRLL